MFCAFIKKKEVPNVRVMNFLPARLNPCHNPRESIISKYTVVMRRYVIVFRRVVEIMETKFEKLILKL